MVYFQQFIGGATFRQAGMQRTEPVLPRSGQRRRIPGYHTAGQDIGVVTAVFGSSAALAETSVASCCAGGSGAASTEGVRASSTTFCAVI